MIIDWAALKREWIEEVRDVVIPRLLADTRFVNSAALVKRFANAVDRWEGGGDFKPVIHDGNELAAASELLRDMRPGDRLVYEPKLIGTKKSIDFKVEWHDGGMSWIDMKTVAPLWQDDAAAWARIQAIAKATPANNHLLLDQYFSGAAIGGQWLKARWSFVARAVELEKKIASLTAAECGSVRLLLCNNGAWHEDDLEDFADFYHSGRFRPDDWAQNAIAAYMAERNITFNRTIAGFIYLERKHDEAQGRQFTIDVKGPRFAAAG